MVIESVWLVWRLGVCDCGERMVMGSAWLRECMAMESVWLWRVHGYGECVVTGVYGYGECVAMESAWLWGVRGYGSVWLWRVCGYAFHHVVISDTHFPWTQTSSCVANSSFIYKNDGVVN